MKGHWLSIIFIFFVAISFAQKADIVLVNAKIITLRSPGDIAQFVAIKADRIIGVGTREQISKYIDGKTKVINLHGKTVIPGFNDVHQHPAPLYNWDKPYATLRLDTVSSMQSLVNLLKRKASVTPKGMLITGVGYNEVKLGAHPTRDILDQATSEHPVLITHASGHLSAANSFTLEINHITSNTMDPPGGAFERDAKGVPDGIIKESARRLLNSDKMIRPPKPSPEEELEGYKKYFTALLGAGITSIGDCNTSPDKVKIYKTLVAEHFPLRFNLYIGVDYLDQLLSGKIVREQSAWLRINGVKIFHGNSLSGKTCWLYEPYDTINPVTGKKDYYGIPPARSQSALDSLVLKIHKAGLQIACHSNGDREIDMIITAIEHAQRAYYRSNPRHRIEHMSICNQGILDRVKKDSIVPVFHSYINELGTQLLVYGTERLSMLIPTRSALDMGIPFAMHSDYPISRYEAMVRLGGAVNRTTANGITLGANQKIGIEEAIKASTSGGAYTSFEENSKGKIVKGQFADMIVLDKDPLSIDPKLIPTIQVLTTIVGGKIVFEKKNLN